MYYDFYKDLDGLSGTIPVFDHNSFTNKDTISLLFKIVTVVKLMS